MPVPQLDPPCIGWQEDLPPPDVSPNRIPDLGLDSPNHLDDVYLEVCRNFIRARMIVLCFFPILASSTVAALVVSIPTGEKYDSVFLIMGLCTFLICFTATIHSARQSTCVPRDLPMRFNRIRRRIYVYDFRHRWWNPFERWCVVTVAYDWAQVRAERWQQRGVTLHGAIIIKHGVVISIVQSGTNRVIDRFVLSTMGADEHAWAYVCTYMQLGPTALPVPAPPRDHNDVPWYNLALRLAPKVQWPDEMDRESRTAP